ncbi:FAD/NAD(P)-binding protein [Hydrogenophaga palleronii]|uniref:FAD/NAD(P)-binding protein n=1 Tax=Hydrogenophaga palleronii TaxID=65655 RepID=UPI000826E967|nr:FAD/NAD(P)-binding protein [Hydrogenophaga palleronii]
MSSETAPSTPRRVTIVGGGFSGVSAAVQLVRHSPVPLAITLIESRDRVGPGLAYATHDPDHRLNAPTWAHAVDPVDGEHFTHWCQARGVFEADPEAMQPSGSAFVRRAVFGAYLEYMVHSHASGAATGSTIRTLQDRALHATQVGDTVNTVTERGQTLTADLLLLATGNAEPRLQAPLDPALAQHPGVIENPLVTARLLGIPRDARVLIIGSGLTSLDVVSTLQRQGHTGGITVVSRRGLRPRAQPQASGPVEPPVGRQNLDRLLAPAPAFLTGVQPELRTWVRTLRAQIRASVARGETWNLPFDELRDSVWQLWPTLPAAQQRRFLRVLRPWYDVHRFRSPPQTEAINREALATGRVVHIAARLRSLAAPSHAHRIEALLQPAGGGTPITDSFDVVVNCTGLDATARTAGNPLLKALVDQGTLRADACGIGYAVDPHCRVINAQGEALSRIRLIGPPTLGTFGDPGGAMFIAAQIHRMLPDVLRFLGERAPLPGLADQAASLSAA